MIVGGSWLVAASAFSTSSPDMPGMRMSSSTTSGFTRGIVSTACVPSPASATTRMRIGKLQQRADALAHQRLIVDETDFDHAAPSSGSQASSAKP